MFADASVFLSGTLPKLRFKHRPSTIRSEDATVRKAIHAPDMVWAAGVAYNFGNTNTLVDPSELTVRQDQTTVVDLLYPGPEPMVFLDDLATNATNHNVSVVIFSGNKDSLVPHRGSEVVIQVSLLLGYPQCNNLISLLEHYFWRDSGIHAEALYTMV